jgi:hypothetical protein
LLDEFLAMRTFLIGIKGTGGLGTSTTGGLGTSITGGLGKSIGGGGLGTSNTGGLGTSIKSAWVQTTHNGGSVRSVWEAASEHNGGKVRSAWVAASELPPLDLVDLFTTVAGNSIWETQIRASTTGSDICSEPPSGLAAGVLALIFDDVDDELDADVEAATVAGVETASVRAFFTAGAISPLVGGGGILILDFRRLLDIKCDSEISFLDASGLHSDLFLVCGRPRP